MAARLSELLERIRPAGTPGAPSEGELQRRDARRADEIATLTALLASFEAEADAVVAEAVREADQLRSEGQRQARELVARLPNRIAVAEAEAARSHERLDQLEAEQLGDEAAQSIARLQARAAGEIPQLVDDIIDVIWSVRSTA
jgi:vacuolar-type H+-ATPase subunit H